MMKRLPIPLLIAALGLLVLPPCCWRSASP